SKAILSAAALRSRGGDMSALKESLVVCRLLFQREGRGSKPPDFCGVTTLEATMTNLFSRFVRDESGATAIEYGLIAALIAVVIITVLTTIGTNLSAKFNSV